MRDIVELGKKDTRSGFGAGLLEIGREDSRIMALCADLVGSLKMDAFAKEFPDRYIECGIAEANMIGVAAGLAVDGFIPFAGTFAAFASGRVYDQIRQSVAYSDTNVKIAASHAGITLGEDGATHQILEDIGLMRMLPGMTVLVPADYNQTKAATIAAAKHLGPVYLRFGRPAVPIFIPEDEPFEIGKAQMLHTGNDLTIIATGHLVWQSWLATKELEAKGIAVDLINIHTIKPLDERAILESASTTGRVVVAEEHMRNGGLGDAVSQLLTQNCCSACVEYVSVNDKFGESGTPDQLMEKYGLTAKDVYRAASDLLERCCKA